MAGGAAEFGGLEKMFYSSFPLHILRGYPVPKTKPKEHTKRKHGLWQECACVLRVTDRSVAGWTLGELSPVSGKGRAAWVPETACQGRQGKGSRAVLSCPSTQQSPAPGMALFPHMAPQRPLTGGSCAAQLLPGEPQLLFQGSGPHTEPSVSDSGFSRVEFRFF